MIFTLHNQSINLEDGDTLTVYKYNFDENKGITIKEENYKAKITIFESGDAHLGFENDEHCCSEDYFSMCVNSIYTAYYLSNDELTKSRFIDSILKKIDNRINWLEKEKIEKDNHYDTAITKLYNMHIKAESLILMKKNNLSENNVKELCNFANKVVDKLCGDHAVIDTGSIFDVMNVVLDALNNLNEKDLNKVQKIVMGKYWLS